MANRRKQKARKVQKRLELTRWRRRVKRKLVQRAKPRKQILATLGEEFFVKIPATVGLGGKTNHRLLTNSLTQLRTAFHQSQRRICIDFSATGALMPEGMLLLYSELQMLRARYPDRQVRCTGARSVRVSQVLQHLGVYASLGYVTALEPDREDVTQWKKCHADWVYVAEAGKMIDAYETYLAFTRAQSSMMFRGISEAITNVKNHAYSKSRRDGLEGEPQRNWWMFSRESSDSLYLGVCDLGIGIPRSLPPMYPRELIAKAMAVASLGKRPHDGAMIAAAMELSRSRMLEANRGKGFRDMLNLANNVKDSTLWVFSNRGLYRYSNGHEKVLNFRDSILGTIVIWRLPFGISAHGE